MDRSFFRLAARVPRLPFDLRKAGGLHLRFARRHLPPRSIGIKRAAYALSASVKDVGVDHGGGNVFVAVEFLGSANVVAVVEQMRGEGVAALAYLRSRA